jgi:raffinose/stachyose/melibiose transport system substrate-binding protein
MKKLLSLALCVVMMLAVVSCAQKESGPSETTASGQEKTTTQTTASEGKPKKNVKLEVMSWFDAQVLGQMYQDTFTETAEELGYEIVFDSMGSKAFETKMKVLLAGDDLPDVLTMWGNAQQTAFINAGAFLPMEEYIENSGFDFVKSNLVKMFDGHVYVVPAVPGSAWCLYYNKEILGNLNMDPPKNLDDIKTLVQKLKDNPDIHALGLGVKDLWLGDFLYMALAMREDPSAVKQAINREISFESEPFLRAANRVKELVDMGAFADNFVQITAPEAAEMFKAGKFACMPQGAWMWDNFLDGLGDKFGYTTFPQMGEDANYTDTVMMTPPFGLSVSSKSQYIDESVAYVFKYVEKINKYKAENGQIPLINTDIKPTKEVHPEYQKLLDDLAKATAVVPTWSDDYTDAKQQAMYNLAQQLFGGVITPEKYVEEAEKVANTPQ